MRLEWSRRFTSLTSLMGSRLSVPTAAPRVLLGRLLPTSGLYALDPVHTFVSFRVQHLVVGQVVGRFDETHGTITLTDDPQLASLDVTVVTKGVSTHNAMRDEDLRSARFFNVAEYPTMTYRSAKVIAELEGWTVDGSLTVRDVTRPVPLYAQITGPVEEDGGRVRFGIHAQANASRKDFGLLTDLERESGGLILRNDIVITIDAEALLQGH